MKKVFLIIAFIIAAPVLSQNINTWRNYTNMENVNDIYVLNGTLWAATEGGVFSYHLADGSFVSYNKAEGLTEFEATAISIDNLGRIWIGFNNGAINVFNPKSGAVRAILDIYDSEKNQPRINDIFIHGDTVFVSADFGISLIDPETFSFYDSFSKFGSWAYDLKINSVYPGNELFVAGISGIAKQKPGATNLASPDSWQNYQIGSANSVNRILMYNSEVLAATSIGLWVFRNSVWEQYNTEISSRNIKDIFTSGDSLFILADNEVLSYYNGSLSSKALSSNLAVNFFMAEGVIFLATNKGALLHYPSGETFDAYPSGPAGNTFPDMEVDNNGILWCASASDNGKGIYKFDGTVWTNINSSNSNLPNNIFKINISPESEVYASSWGSGFTILRNNFFYTVNDNNYPEIVPFEPGYMVAGDAACDSDGNIWFLNSESKSNKHLAKLNIQDSSLTQYINSMLPSAEVKALSLVVDQYDTKWFGVIETSGRMGLYFYNENINLPGNSLGWGYVSLGTTTEANEINSLILDNRGELWIGKKIGISIISDPQKPSSVTFSFPMHEETINCIAVDAVNQKWVGTNRGLFLLSQDGSSLIKEYNTDNSPLLVNDIRSLAIDKKKGIIYIGSDKGLTVLSSEYMQPEESFSDIFVYPSPFIVSEGQNTEVTIDGLIKDSEIKIFNLTGRLIREFASPGGRVAFWNGRDTDGNLVGSGIYIVTAFDAEGNNISSAKMAVIKK